MEQLRMSLELDNSIEPGVLRCGGIFSEQKNKANYSSTVPDVPVGYAIRQYAPGDEVDWCRCCYGSEMGVKEISAEEFFRFMGGDETVELCNIYFLVSEKDGIVGTTTYQHRSSPGEANIHMVGLLDSHRGRGLSRCMLQYALQKIASDGKKTVRLSTDDWRLPAIKTYLNCGFLPDTTDEGVKARWRAVLGKLGVN